VGKLLGQPLGYSLGSVLGAPLGEKLGSVLEIALGTELGARLGLLLGVELGMVLRSITLSNKGSLVCENTGNAEGDAVGDVVGDSDLHLVLQMFGQKNLTFSPLTGSFLLHLLFGLVETHVEQSLSGSLLKRKVSLSSHSPRSSVGEDVGNADAVGDSVRVSVGVVVRVTVVGIGLGASVIGLSERANDGESDGFDVRISCDGVDDSSSVALAVGSNVDIDDVV